MIGQGGPQPSWRSRTRRGRWVRRGIVCCALAAIVLGAATVAAEEIELAVRIAFGGGADRQWRGAVAVSEGTIRSPVPLGIESDAAATFYPEDDPARDGTRLAIGQRSPRAYDGVDLVVRAPREARLSVELAAEGGQPPQQFDVPLAQLLTGYASFDLDNRGNRLLVRRRPGDSLRVVFARHRLVFRPGEHFELAVQPHLLPVTPGTRMRLSAQLLEARGDREFWSHQASFLAEPRAELMLSVPLPEKEGVYDLVLSAAADRSTLLPQSTRIPLGFTARTTAERRVQVIVLAEEAPPPSSEQEPALVVEIDPTSPSWWERFARLPHLQLPALSRLWKGPLGSGHSRVAPHGLGPVVELPPKEGPGGIAWEAYTLPVQRTGRPHVLEIDYPSDLVQTLSISILEPNPAGALMPSGLDSGVDVAEEPIALDSGQAPEWLRHRLVFWPRTRTPMVLVVNRRPDKAAAFGRIRVLSLGEALPPTEGLQESSGRLAAAYLDRPQFPRNFSASEARDQGGPRCLDDWVTFYEGGSRLVEYLRHVGYGGLMMVVAADGGAIYPSRLLNPSPRYDTGTLFESAQDPVRKDVLEMLFRLFDREGLVLIPTLDFATPLPELERRLREADRQDEGLRWIGPDGRPWEAVHAAPRRLAPYYNLLRKEVQEAMLAVVRELLDEYGSHPSFAGMAVKLSARGYAQLPGPQWGMDDATIAAFTEATGIEVPGEGPQRFAARAEFLGGPSAPGPQQRAWLQWRAEQLDAFYRRVHEEIARVRPEGRLYLTGGEMFAGPEWEYALRPALPRRMSMAEALLRTGVRWDRYHRDQPIVLLRPVRVAPQEWSSAEAVDLELAQMHDAYACFQDSPQPGTLFFHPAAETRLPSFDETSPFQPALTWLSTQAVPSAAQNRRRFVQALAAMDAAVFFDGGPMLPMGQEEPLREVLAAFRRLPETPFRTVGGGGGSPGSSQPVVIRAATHDGSTYAYAVNETSLPVTVRVGVEGPAGLPMEDLSGRDAAGRLRMEAGAGEWAFALRPYDLLAVRFAAADVRLGNPRVDVGREVETALGARIRDLGARAGALRNPSPLPAPANADFEMAANGGIPHWRADVRPGVRIEIDAAEKSRGTQSVRLSSEGAVGSLVSEPLSVPTTGRLSMWVWLRTAEARRQPPLRLALHGRLRGEEYYRFAPVGAEAVPLTTQWAPYIFQVDDLPLEGLSDLRIRFDLMGAGEVWVDDVRLNDLAFSPAELVEISKLIATADAKLQNGHYRDCLRLLSGYWPRFLDVHVPPQPTVLASPAAPARSPPQPAAAEPSAGLTDRLRGLLPRRLW